MKGLYKKISVLKLTIEDLLKQQTNIIYVGGKQGHISEKSYHQLVNNLDFQIKQLSEKLNHLIIVKTLVEQICLN